MEEKTISDEQIDIIWVLKYILAKRKFIAIVVCATTLLTIIVCLCKPNVYTAKASILPVSENHNMSGNMGALASMAGFNIGAQSSSSAIITSDLYPKVAESIPFLSSMVDVKVPWPGVDSLMSYYEYSLIDTIPTVGDLIKKYTIYLPTTIMSTVNGTTPSVMKKNIEENLPYLSIESKRMAAMNKMRQMVSVADEPIYGTIEVSVNAPSPEQASILTTKALEMIQSTATEHKTRRAKEILKFAEERYEDAMKEYEDIHKKFSIYKDTHRNMVTERMGSEYQKLSDKYDLTRSILNTISSQVEQSRFELMQNTPVFTVIDPVVLPSGKSGPKMFTHILVGIVLGLVGALGWLLMQIAWWQAFDEEKVSKLREIYR